MLNKSQIEQALKYLPRTSIKYKKRKSELQTGFKPSQREWNNLNIPRSSPKWKKLKKSYEMPKSESKAYFSRAGVTLYHYIIEYTIKKKIDDDGTYAVSVLEKFFVTMVFKQPKTDIYVMKKFREMIKGDKDGEMHKYLHKSWDIHSAKITSRKIVKYN